MINHLRTIGLTVNESDPGVFFWVLMESTEDATVYAELVASFVSFSTYAQALDAGVAALKSFITDLAIGPRLAG